MPKDRKNRRKLEISRDQALKAADTVVTEVREATDPDSPGGAKITIGEWWEIISAATGIFAAKDD
jgi:hypothetical protein